MRGLTRFSGEGNGWVVLRLFLFTWVQNAGGGEVCSSEHPCCYLSLSSLVKQYFTLRKWVFCCYVFLSRWDFSVWVSFWYRITSEHLCKNSASANEVYLILTQFTVCTDSLERLIRSEHIWSEFIASNENRQAWLGFFFSCQEFVHLYESLLTATGHTAPKLRA